MRIWSAVPGWQRCEMAKPGLVKPGLVKPGSAKPGYFARLAAPQLLAATVLMPNSRPAPLAAPVTWGEALAAGPPPVAAESEARVSEVKAAAKTQARAKADPRISTPPETPPRAAGISVPETRNVLPPDPFNPDFAAPPRAGKPQAELGSDQFGATPQAAEPEFGAPIAKERDREANIIAPATAPKMPDLPSIFTIPPIAALAAGSVSAPGAGDGGLADNIHPLPGGVEPIVPPMEGRLWRGKTADDASLIRPTDREHAQHEAAAAPQESPAPILSIGVIEVRAAPPAPPPAPPARVVAQAPANSLARPYASRFGFGQS